MKLIIIHHKKVLVFHVFHNQIDNTGTFSRYMAVMGKSVSPKNAYISV